MNLQGYYTTKGLTLAAKTAAGTKLTVTKVTAGSGETAKSATVLAGEKQTLTTGTATVSGQTAVLPVTLAEAKASVAYQLTELGVYANDPDEGEILYQVFRLDEVRAISAGGENVYRFYLKQTVGAAGITVTCSPAGLLVDEDLAPTRSKVLMLSVPSRTATLTAAELQGYLDALPRMLTEALTIYISGTAAETLTIRDFYGPGSLQLEVLDGQSCTLSKGLLVKNCRIQIRVISVTITPNTAGTLQFCVAAEEASYVRLGVCTIAGNGSSVGVNSRRDGLVLVENCTVTNHKICAQAETGSRLCFSNTSGNGTYSGSQLGAYVWWGGMILLSEAVPELLGGTANSHSGGLIVKADGTVI